MTEPLSNIVDEAVFYLLDSPKLISHKIWVTGKSWIFNTLDSQPKFVRSQCEKWKIDPHEKTILSNQLFSNFSNNKNVDFTKFVPKKCEINFHTFFGKKSRESNAFTK